MTTSPTMPNLHKNQLFAPLDADLHLERIGGGNETEVYRTDDHRYVVKVKSTPYQHDATTLEQAIVLRKAARRFATVMTKHHSIPNYFLIAQGDAGVPQLLAVQPHYGAAQPLAKIDYAQLKLHRRAQLAGQLLYIIWRAVGAYFKRGWMPDLYGRASTSHSERERLNQPHMLPWRLWSFLVQRNLLRAHNLMLNGDDQRVILVDYDPVTRGKLYQQVYYTVRLWLFWRDLLLIGLMVLTGYVPTLPKG